MRNLSPRADAVERYLWHVGAGFELLVIVPVLVVVCVLCSPLFLLGLLRRRLSE